MSVVSTKELAQTLEREVGRPAIVKRRLVCVLADGTLQNDPATELEILAAVFNTTTEVIASSAIFGEPHPRLAAWKLRKVWINEGFEGSPYHVEVVLEYGIVRDEELLAPTSRPAVWSFEGSSGEFPALRYFDGSGNGTTYPLTNSAFDFYPGLMTTESVVLMKVTKNFAAFPSGWYAANNSVNDATYFGCDAHTIRVAGIDTTYEYDEFGGAVVKYWKATATLAYRQSGHNLLLPDVGYNFIDGGQKRRAMVFDFQNSEWVPSPNPVGLNGSGGLNMTGNATVLNRRVNPETNFQTVFGTPPT
jgi:hypothetical protein